MPKYGKPIIIDGIAVVPKWDWTPRYCREVRQQFKVPEKSEETIALQYARWLARRDGIEMPWSNRIAFTHDYASGRCMKLTVLKESWEVQGKGRHKHCATTWDTVAEFALAQPNGPVTAKQDAMKQAMTLLRSARRSRKHWYGRRDAVRAVMRAIAFGREALGHHRTLMQQA